MTNIIMLFKKISNFLKFSDFSVKFRTKSEKITKKVKNFFYLTLRGWMLIYFIKHINPLFILQDEEKESIFFKNVRGLLSFVISVILTGIAVNFILYALFGKQMNIFTITAYGLFWWLIQKQILKKGIDYLTIKIREMRR